MSKRTINMQTSHHRIETISFFSSLAVFAGVAHILDGFESCSLTDFEVFDSVSDFDDDSCAFVACAFGAELRPENRQYLCSVCGSWKSLHWWHAPILHHEVDV
jgi:hypothetical protein